MSWAVHRAVLPLVLVALCLNIVAIAGQFGSWFKSEAAATPPENFDIIQCADATGAVHKCIRIDPKAGEVTYPTGASYRVIFGH